MAGLVLKLPAGERVLVNGAVLENAGRAGRLRVLTPNTQLLRLRDAVDPTRPMTPVSRIAHVVQMMLLGECDAEAELPDTLSAMIPLRHAFLSVQDRDLVDKIMRHLEDRRFYQALRTLGTLREREAALLGALK